MNTFKPHQNIWQWVMSAAQHYISLDDYRIVLDQLVGEGKRTLAIKN